jgi:hypothetical protein
VGVAERPIPPDDKRCRGFYSTRYHNPNKVGQRCEQPATRGEYCYKHAELPDNERCTGRLSKHHPTTPGGPCPYPRLKGQTVCYRHGGKSPQALAGAQRRLQEKEARRRMTTYGKKIDTGPTEALLDEVQWTAGHVAWLRERVREVENATAVGDRSALVWSTIRRKTGGEDWGETEEAIPNIWVRLYQAERAHLVKVCAEAIKAGIEERRVRLAEQQGALVAQAIRAILDDLGLTPEQQAKVPDIVPRHLRALAS